jgi:hypothetical protein
MGHDPIPTDDLDEIACGKSFSLHGAQRKKSVDRSLLVANSYWFSWQEAGLKQNGPNEEAGKRQEADS